MGTKQFNLPDLGEGLEDAEIVRWLVADGDDVELNQPLIEVDTAKALVEIPSPVAGRIAKLHAAEGDTVAVGAALVTFEVEGSEEESTRTSVLVGYGVDEGKTKRKRRLTATKSHEAGSGVQAAPPVRKLAGELGIDLHDVTGTGPGGRITREDVKSAADGGSAGSDSLTIDGPVERVAVKGIRGRIAEKMTKSVSEIPHVTTFLVVDAGEILAVRREGQQRAGEVKVTSLAVISKAFVEICKAHPKLNASWDSSSGEVVLRKYYHLGVATDTKQGLTVPVIRDADTADLVSLATEISRLAEAARSRTAKPEEMTGSTVTVSNVGTFGSEFGTPIINYPESSILAVGLISDKPAVVDGKIVARPEVTFSLSFDHRIADGAEAGRALLELKNLLEDGDALRKVCGI